MTSTDHEDLSTLFATITHVQDDAGISPTKSGQGYALGTSVETNRDLHVGDVVRFACQGADPRGRDLRWWLHPHGYEPTSRTVGNQVDLQWTVEPQSVGQRVYLGIGMAADSEYHREGGLGDNGWDGWVRYLFTVNP